MGAFPFVTLFDVQPLSEKFGRILNANDKLGFIVISANAPYFSKFSKRYLELELILSINRGIFWILNSKSHGEEDHHFPVVEVE